MSSAIAGTPTDVVPRSSDVVLAAENVSVDYEGDRVTHAVREVSIDLHRGEVLGIAGESGCGKSTLAYAMTHLLRPPARLVGGSVKFFPAGAPEPVDLSTMDAAALRKFRWKKISMVFQSAMNSLNPVTSVARQFDDIFKAHSPEMDAASRRAQARELLELVEIDPDRVSSFPHELSGGQRQRVMIAMALALNPEVVVMDEPTTALDVVVQQEILDEVQRLREQFGFSVIFITHDLSLLLEVSDRLAVMYAGEIVELAPTTEVQRAPSHPYTRGLLGAFPDLRGIRRDLRGIPGSPPDLSEPVVGCAFAPRCGYAFGPCASTAPTLRFLRAGTDVEGSAIPSGSAAETLPSTGSGRAGAGGPGRAMVPSPAGGWPATCTIVTTIPARHRN